MYNTNTHAHLTRLHPTNPRELCYAYYHNEFRIISFSIKTSRRSQNNNILCKHQRKHHSPWNINHKVTSNTTLLTCGSPLLNTYSDHLEANKIKHKGSASPYLDSPTSNTLILFVFAILGF